MSSRRRAIFLLVLACVCLTPFGLPAVDEKATDELAGFHVPPGFVVECVAQFPLVEHPMMAAFDERGRLFIAESVGLNWKKEELLAKPPNRIRLLPAADEKGQFRAGHIFADRMTLPMGVLWHNGVLYSASPPSLWTLRDRDADGVADERRELVTKFGFTGNAADIHGPALGPDGWIYWCDGRHGHDIVQADGTKLAGKAARIFRCRPDGTNVEVVCGGGMDNPVELAFTDEGEAFATVNILHNRPARNDGLIYCIEGGVYPWHDVYQEFPLTGDLLPAVEDLGWVAPSGLMRYRGSAFGPGYQGNLFSAQFNRSRIQRHILERNGASFKIKTEDFLVVDDKNFHPTDVLEDADGSLLVINTGGWFRIGCPTSRIALPEIKGSIYRIRKQDSVPPEDPRGLMIAWEKSGPFELAPLLDDPRFMVRDRAVNELAQRGAAAVPALAEVLATSRSKEACRNAVWALTRIDDPEARKLVRNMLSDADFSVRLAATHSAGLHRDGKALSKLLAHVADPKEHPAIRRESATALGRIKNGSAVPALMEGMRHSGDRFLDHALIFALIRIGSADKVAGYLKDVNPAVQRAALVSLDQMQGSTLTREMVTPLLSTEDRTLQLAALKIVAARPAWSGEIVALLDRWLAEPKLEQAKQDLLRGVVQSMHKEPAIQKLVADTLHSRAAPPSARLLLLEAIGQISLAELSPAWSDEIRSMLAGDDEALLAQTVATVRALSADKFDGELLRLARNAKLNTEVRLSALAATAVRLKSVDQPLFEFAVRELAATQEPLRRLAAASALASAPLDAQQLQALLKILSGAGPLELPHLLGPFEKSNDANIGRGLIAALEASPGLPAVPPGALDRVFANYPVEVRKGTAKLQQRLLAETEKQRGRLAELEPMLTGGDADRGRLVFFGARAACSACHTAEKRGGRIGPELSAIGAIRSGRDLLEAVVFPSSSFARGFEPYLVETRSGVVHQGILGRETADALFLVTADRTELRVPRSEIDSVLPGRVSIMPQGLDTQLGPQELKDLLAYLQGLR